MVDNDCEFPPIPKNFEGIQVTPNPFVVNGKTWKYDLIIRNHAESAILYKVKCTSNKRIKITDCADILLPGNEISVEVKKIVEADEKDQLLVLYCLVGKQWSSEDSNAFEAWNRVKSREVPVKNIIVPITDKK